MMTEEMLAEILARLEEMNAQLRSMVEPSTPSSPPSTSVLTAASEEREVSASAISIKATTTSSPSLLLPSPTSEPPQDAALDLRFGALKLHATSPTKCSTPGPNQDTHVPAAGNSDRCDHKVLNSSSNDLRGVDRLSCLPDSLRRDIIGRLPVKDAARTAVLSRHWKRIWGTSAVPHLGHLGLRIDDIEGGVPIELFDRSLDALFVVTTNSSEEQVLAPAPAGPLDDFRAACGIHFAHGTGKLEDRASLKADDAAKSLVDHDPSVYITARAWRPPWLRASRSSPFRRRCSPPRDSRSSYIAASALEFLIRPYDPGAGFVSSTRDGVHFDSEEAEHARVKTFVMGLLSRGARIWPADLRTGIGTMLEASSLATTASALRTSSPTFKPSQEANLGFQFGTSGLIYASPTRCSMRSFYRATPILVPVITCSKCSTFCPNSNKCTRQVQDGKILQVILIFFPDEIEKHIKSVTLAIDVQGMRVHRLLTSCFSEIISLDDLVMSASPLCHAAQVVYFLGSFMVLPMQVRLEPWPSFGQSPDGCSKLELWSPAALGIPWCLVIYNDACLFAWSCDQIKISVGRQAPYDILVHWYMEILTSESYTNSGDVIGEHISSRVVSVPLFKLLESVQKIHGIAPLLLTIIFVVFLSQPCSSCWLYTNSWSEKTLLSDGFLLKFSPWCTLNLGFIELSFSENMVATRITPFDQNNSSSRFPVSCQVEVYVAISMDEVFWQPQLSFRHSQFAVSFRHSQFAIGIAFLNSAGCRMLVRGRCWSSPPTQGWIDSNLCAYIDDHELVKCFFYPPILHVTTRKAAVDNKRAGHSVLHATVLVSLAETWRFALHSSSEDFELGDCNKFFLSKGFLVQWDPGGYEAWHHYNLIGLGTYDIQMNRNNTSTSLLMVLQLFLPSGTSYSILQTVSAPQSEVPWDPGISEVLQILNIATHGLGASRVLRRGVCHDTTRDSSGLGRLRDMGWTWTKRRQGLGSSVGQEGEQVKIKGVPPSPGRASKDREPEPATASVCSSRGERLLEASFG